MILKAIISFVWIIVHVAARQEIEMNFISKLFWYSKRSLVVFFLFRIALRGSVKKLYVLTQMVLALDCSLAVDVVDYYLMADVAEHLDFAYAAAYACVD